MQNDILKPCPLCGGAAIMHEPPLAHAFRVSCANCRCNTGGYKTEDEARDAWNKRKPAIVYCWECEYWKHTGDGRGDCINPRFHLDGHADPTMLHNEYCAMGERSESA